MEIYFAKIHFSKKFVDLFGNVFLEHFLAFKNTIGKHIPLVKCSSTEFSDTFPRSVFSYKKCEMSF
jgi:hypothetical protein